MVEAWTPDRGLAEKYAQGGVVREMDVDLSNAIIVDGPSCECPHRTVTVKVVTQLKVEGPVRPVILRGLIDLPKSLGTHHVCDVVFFPREPFASNYQQSLKDKRGKEQCSD